MEAIDFSRFIGALVFIIGLIWLSALAIKHFGLDKRLRGITGSAGRLQICDVLYLDPKRKLIIVRADKTEYLLLLAGESASVLSTTPSSASTA